jgi:YesN/AraC family two-component response regulator
MNHITASPGPHHSMHVLLVDDDEFMLELIADMLRDLGISSITTAADGRRGIAAFQSAMRAPDIVICDINMPDTDGFQMMELLAKENRKCGFILMSGLDQRYVNSATLMARFHHLNILGALHKPVEKHALADLVAKWQRSSAT